MPDPPPDQDERQPDAILPPSPDGFEVIDDEELDPEGSAVAWAAAELVGGRTFEAVGADLVAGGWAADAAERVVERARQQTRAERGVVTRDDVARGAERRYRHTIAAARWVAFGGLPGLFILFRNVLVALRGVRAGPRRPEGDESHGPSDPSLRRGSDS